MNILIPAIGNGSRFKNSKYTLPKPVIKVDGMPMLVRSAKSLQFVGTYIFLVKENEYREQLVQDIYKEFPTAKIGVVADDTEGAAQSALLAEHLIDSDEELIIANCDQIMDSEYWNAQLALAQLRKYDGGIVTITSSDVKHSYARIENNLVVEVVEKKLVSDMALTGIHYWKKGSDFVMSAKNMIDNDIRATDSEFYIGPSYNQLIKTGKKINFCKINQKAIHFIGTPADLENYESR